MEIRPYLYAGLGSNILRKYRLVDGCAEIETRKWLLFRGIDRLPLAGTRITVVPRAFGLGDIKIVPSSGQPMWWMSVRRVNDVVQRLNNVAQGKPEAGSKPDEPSKPDGPPWHLGLDVETDVVVVPIGPDQFASVLYTARMGGGFSTKDTLDGLRDERLVNEGDWVRKGQKIAVISGSAVVAPVDGRVALGGCAMTWRWSCETNWTSAGSGYENECLIAIHPVRGRAIESAGYCYSRVIDRVRNAINLPGYKKELTRDYRESDEAEERFREAVHSVNSLISSVQNGTLPIRRIEYGKLLPLKR